MRPLVTGVLLALASATLAEPACAHGGRGIRRGDTGFENELRLARLGKGDLKPEEPDDPRRLAEDERDAPRPDGRRRLTQNVAWSDYDWQQWWAVNRWSVLPDRADIAKRRARWEIESGAKPRALGTRVRARRDARRGLRASTIVPALLRALAATRPEPDDVRAACLLALGKCAFDAEHVEVLWAHASDAEASGLVRRSAALGLGLLRRTRAEDRFRPELIDLVRRRLFRLFDDEAADRTTRAFAMYAVGLLADQPDGKAMLDGRVVARELWKRLEKNYRAHDLPVALLTALGMQSRLALPARRPDDLKRIVDGTWIERRRWNHYERGHAMLAQARLNAHRWDELVWYVNSTQRKYPTFIRMSTFIALADQVAALSGGRRRPMAISLIVSMRAARNHLTRGLAHVAMARLLNQDLRAGSEQVLENTRAFRWLLEEARYRGEFYFIHASFAALGVGLAAHDLPQGIAKGAAVRAVSARRLVDLFHKDTISDNAMHHYRASCVAALGCTEHEDAVPTLLRILGKHVNTRRPETYYAPVALGQIGMRTPRTLNALRGVLVAKTTSAELRSQILLAQVMLGDPGVRPMLVRELALGTSTWAAAQVVLAIGLHDDLSLARPILEMARDPRRTDRARAYAYAALGFLGDAEERGSILRLLVGANYPLRTRASTALHSVL